MSAPFQSIKDFLSGEWKSILLSLFLHLIVFYFSVSIPVVNSGINPPPVNKYVELGTIPDELKQFKESPVKPDPAKVIDKTKEIKPGVRPDNVVRNESGKKGGSISGFNGEGGEALGIKGVGEGAGSAGEGGTGQQGSDVYRVGVEEMPEPYGGKAAIISKIPPGTPELETARGKSIYVLAFIDETGIVRKAQISKGVGGAIDAAAANAVRKTRFKPGKDKGRVVRVQLMLNLTL